MFLKRAGLYLATLVLAGAALLGLSACGSNGMVCTHSHPETEWMYMTSGKTLIPYPYTTEVCDTWTPRPTPSHS